MKSISDYCFIRRNNFDFIRFMAASAVVFSHAYPVVSGTNETEPFYILTNGQTSIGGTAVSIFFIISGFLVTQSFFNSKSTGRYIRSRALRIFPALAFAVFCTVFILGPLVTSLSAGSYFTSGETYAYLWNALAYTRHSTLPGVFTVNPFPLTVNGSLWSLPYEILYYPALPAIVLLLSKKIFPALGFLCIVFLLTGKGYIGKGYLFDMTNYFFCGSIYYFFRNYILLSRWIFSATLICLAASIYFGFYNFTFGILGGYIILFLAFKVEAGLFHFARFGDFSYGTYLWAFPVQQLVAGNTPGQSPLKNFLFSYPIILVMAFISWHLVEKKSLALKAHLSTNSLK